MEAKLCIEFDNYLVRPLQANDAPKYYSLIANNVARLTTYFPTTVIENQNAESSKAHVAARLARMAEREFFTFVIEDTKEKIIIGIVFIKDINWKIPKGELGFYIDADYEGKGVLSKSLQYVITYAFSELKFIKVFMRVAEENTRSRKVAERLGFVTEGIIRKDFKTTEGEVIDVLYFGLLATETKFR
ncbi:MAG: GNAT family N-acetyltransferase [Bacteroidia bacterium]|nr:GNAT family N-acetyltransferase [Bacteroidia bacterium]